MSGHRKRARHYHEPGDLHELTFSCYRRMPLITNDDWRKLLCESIDRAIENWSYRLVAFVVMPEHLHLLVLPTTQVVRVDRFLSAVKRPHSVRIKKILRQNQSPLLERLTVQERPGKTAFRYWQEPVCKSSTSSVPQCHPGGIHRHHHHRLNCRIVGAYDSDTSQTGQAVCGGRASGSQLELPGLLS